jgi:hypothetical protein
VHRGLEEHAMNNAMHGRAGLDPATPTKKRLTILRKPTGKLDITLISTPCYSSIARIHDFLTVEILNYLKIRAKVEIYRIFVVLTGGCDPTEFPETTF